MILANILPTSSPIGVDDIRALARHGHLVFIIDGWNELSGERHDEAKRNIDNLQKDYPNAGMLIATRSVSLPPKLKMSEQITLNRLSRDKRNEIIRNALAKQQADDRRVISGIVHVLKSGGRWGDAPADYGPKKTLYNRFVRWSKRGIWQDIFAALAGAEGAPDRLMIDSSSIKVHRCARGAKGGPWPMPLVAARVDRTQKSMR